VNTSAPEEAPITILLVDDDDDDRVLVRDELTDAAPGRYAIDWVPTYEQGLATLMQGVHAVGLLDFRLGEQDGLMLVREAQRLGCKAPLILLTGAGLREVDEAALRAGAADYLDKSRLDGELLDRAIRYALERRRVEERTLEVARAEVARDEAEARREQLQELLATISHDLQQPLAAIRARAQLLERQIRRGLVAGDEAVVDGLTQMSDTVMRMAEQLRELVAASRGSGSEALTLHPRPLDLRTLAHSTVEDARQSIRGHVIRLELPDAPVVGNWDEARLERVLANLLSNAAKYSPEGGEIGVRVGTAQDADGVSWATLGVRDQGIGIPTDELGTIFEPFRRGTNAPAEVAGTGIGLASVRQSVELHGGQVRVASQVGNGSEFSIWLPLAPADGRPAGVSIGRAPDARCATASESAMVES
jgi:signal transduction histidine kinase